MKTLIAAVIASAVSFGAFARSAFAPAATAPMAAGDSSVKKTPDHQTTKTTKSTKKPVMKNYSKLPKEDVDGLVAYMMSLKKS